MMDIFDMINGVWIDGQHMEKRNESQEFISDISDILVKIHTLSLKYIVYSFPHINESLMHETVDRLRKHPPPNNEKFCEDAIKEFDEIKDTLSEDTFIHGDLWYKNVIVKDDKVQGLIDWDKKCVGNPHWELRMIRRWIGWAGLKRLIFLYNCSTGNQLNFDKIKTLDKIALCHSYNLRLRKPNPDKPVSVIQGYIQHWPESWWQK